METKSKSMGPSQVGVHHADAPPAYSDIPQGVPETFQGSQPTVSPLFMAPGPQLVVARPPMGPQPQSIACVNCHQQIVTTLKYKNSTKTHLIALGLCGLGCWLCVWIPYCVDSCKNIDHYCPNCEAYIGSYRS